jgi:hypothetical protein
MAFDTWKEKNADDREFAENRRRLDAVGTETKMHPNYGQRSENHPGRQVHRGRFVANTEQQVPHPVADDWEPDYEGMAADKLERRRPVGDTW